MAKGLSPAKIGLLSIALLLAVGAGVGVGITYASPAAPEALAPGTAITAVPVGVVEFDDARSVELAVASEKGRVFVSPGPGRVTATSCVAGGALESGASPYSLNEAPVVALSTSVPLWRDLAVGDEGSDVKALKAELQRLGYSLRAGGAVDKATLGAYRDLLKAAGDTAEPAQMVSAERILWLPAPSVPIARCIVATGDSLLEGDPVATGTGELTSVAVREVPGDLVAGARVLEVGGVVVDIDPARPLTDPETLHQLAASTVAWPSSDDPSTDTGADPVVGRLRLAVPLQASAVPPSALFDLTDGAACLMSGGAVRTVTIVGSELGRTFVVFDDGAAPETVDTKVPAGAQCAST